ncbi:uncharacterized protein [Clytia hemisphaerica]|uniref:uncharacterized protein n=1 Tax=Clytia hemisphaerica TaxID=252671 RepID=UPI0034D3EDDB|eukprot:TCONS_00020853-protein
MENVDFEFFCRLLNGNTYHQISQILKDNYPGERGFSVPSIKLFCKKNGLSSKVSQEQVNEMVRVAVDEVGPAYGRKMMTGYLRQKHSLAIGETRISKALSTVSPVYTAQRRTQARRAINPIPYRADYFGHKLHMDQNEKLVMYGVTHVAAIDGHSRFVVATSTMPVKNNLTIYREIYRQTCTDYGMFHQIRVDGGKEFYLTLGMQDIYGHLRSRQDIAKYRQTQSKQNLPIERFWPEVNIRVNYPIKAILVRMDNNGSINMACEVQKFCVSFVSCAVSGYGINVVAKSWNQHTIPGRGKPANIKENTNQLQPINHANLPEALEAKQEYETRYAGQLVDEHAFGIDPLQGFNDQKARRLGEFSQRFRIKSLFEDCINNRPQSFENAVLFFIRKTHELVQGV